MLTLQNDKFIRKNFNESLNSYDKKYLNLDEKGLLNLYYLFINLKNFESNHWLKNVPYIRLDNKLIFSFLEKLPNSYKLNFFLNLRKELSFYVGRKKVIFPKNLKNWIKNNSYPLPFIRVLSYIYSKENKVNESFVLKEIFKNLKYIEEINRRTKFKPPMYFSDLFTDFNFYLIGCTFGDGHLTKYLWRLADGNPNINLLKYSLYYLKRILTKLEKEFLVKGCIRKDKISNMYEIIISNKLFSQFIHYFFDVPFGRKDDFKLPFLMEFTNKKRKSELEMKFLRGIFDSEGYVNNIIAITMANKIFIEKCNDLFKNMGIMSSYKQVRTGYNLQIARTYFPEFAKNIGFFHPLKQKKLINALKKGITKTIFRGIKKNNLIDGVYFNLSKIDNLRIYNLSNWISDLRKELTQKEIGKIVGINDWCVRYWERGVGIKFNHLICLIRFLNLDSDYLYNLLDNNNVLYYIGDIKVSKKVKLPLRLNEDLLFIAKNVRPFTTLLIRKENDIKRLSNQDILKIKNLIKDIFKIEVKYNKINNAIFIENKVLTKFFKTFFVYEKPWKPYIKTKLLELEKSWNFL